jgi:hypothetical protein
VTVTAPGNPTYTWYKDGVIDPTLTGPTITIKKETITGVHKYKCVITTPQFGNVTSTITTQECTILIKQATFMDWVKDHLFIIIVIAIFAIMALSILVIIPFIKL